MIQNEGLYITLFVYQFIFAYQIIRILKLEVSRCEYVVLLLGLIMVISMTTYLYTCDQMLSEILYCSGWGLQAYVVLIVRIYLYYREDRPIVVSYGQIDASDNMATIVSFGEQIN